MMLTASDTADGDITCQYNDNDDDGDTLDDYQ